MANTFGHKEKLAKKFGARRTFYNDFPQDGQN